MIRPPVPKIAPLIKPVTTPASGRTTRRIGFVSPLLVAMLSLFAIAAPAKMMLSMPRTTSSRSTRVRFWRFTTSPVYVPVPAGNYCVRRANAARQENRGRGVPPALPAHREWTRLRSSAERSTARPIACGGTLAARCLAGFPTPLLNRGRWSGFPGCRRSQRASGMCLRG